MSKKLEADAELIRALAALLDETGLSEIEFSEGERRVRVVRGRTGAAADNPVAAMPAAVPCAPTAASDASHPGAVTSPMVGTVYVSAEPGAAPLINVGDSIAEGQILLIIEAMKVMNPIKAPHGGTVSQIMVSNGSPVEYGEVLLIIE